MELFYGITAVAALCIAGVAVWALVRCLKDMVTSLNTINRNLLSASLMTNPTERMALARALQRGYGQTQQQQQQKRQKQQNQKTSASADAPGSDPTSRGNRGSRQPPAPYGALRFEEGGIGQPKPKPETQQ